MDITKLIPYSRRLRPNNPDSFPSFVDAELLRLANSSRDTVQALQDLDARLKAAGH